MFRAPFRAPPHQENLKLEMPVGDQVMVVPLEQLWTRLTRQRQQEVLQRLTQMVVQRLVLPDDERETRDE